MACIAHAGCQYKIAAGKSGIEEVNVDAMTGEIVAHEHENAKTEAKEKKAEANEKKKP